MGVDLLSVFFDDKNGKPNQETKQKQKETTTSAPQPTYFPDVTPSPSVLQNSAAGTAVQNQAYSPTPVVNPGLNCEPHLTNVLKQYEQGFDGLNLPGYDFFEFFKGIMQGGVDNLPMYEMAFAMGKSMDPSLTKEKLIKDADYYLNELAKVHSQFNTDGVNRKNQIISDKENESGSLNTEIERLTFEIERMQIELQNKKQALTLLDEKYQAPLMEIDCKLLANDNAKDKMTSLITKVKNNIKI